jgi:hypothetical protein
MEMEYTAFTNVDARFGRPYHVGDRLVRGYSGRVEVEASEMCDAAGVDVVAERLFARHNRDDRRDGEMCPSMSVGDVVVIGEVAVSVASTGFKVVAIDPSDLIVDRPWRQVVDEGRISSPGVAPILAAWQGGRSSAPSAPAAPAIEL